MTAPRAGEPGAIRSRLNHLRLPLLACAALAVVGVPAAALLRGPPGAARVAAAGALTADGPLENLEQPCATVAELAELRGLVEVPIAADESIRKAEDPLHVVRSGAADIAVLKVAPLGGVTSLLNIAHQIDIPIVVSSALDSAVGIGRGLLAAAALPDLRHACGLGTGGFFVDDVADPLIPVDGYLPVTAVRPDPDRLSALAAPPERRQWWIDRIKACFESGRADLVAE